jgi:hypothetical protein
MSYTRQRVGQAENRTVVRWPPAGADHVSDSFKKGLNRLILPPQKSLAEPVATIRKD